MWRITSPGRATSSTWPSSSSPWSYCSPGSRYLPPSLTVYGLLLVAPATLFGTPGSLMGTPRYVLVAFPVFIVLALLLKNRVLLGGWLVMSTLYPLPCADFVVGRFVA